MRERVGRQVVAEKDMVADVVVGVGVEVRADGGGDNLAAVLVGEISVNGRDARCPSSTGCRAGERVKGVCIGIDQR